MQFEIIKHRDQWAAPSALKWNTPFQAFAHSPDETQVEGQTNSMNGINR